MFCFQGYYRDSFPVKRLQATDVKGCTTGSVRRRDLMHQFDPLLLFLSANQVLSYYYVDGLTRSLQHVVSPLRRTNSAGQPFAGEFLQLCASFRLLSAVASPVRPVPESGRIPGASADYRVERGSDRTSL